MEQYAAEVKERWGSTNAYKEYEEKAKRISVKDFRSSEWIEGGIFGDFIQDDYKVYELATTGQGRLEQPVWNKDLCVNCSLCINNCPNSAITRDDENNYSSDDDKCIGCGICEKNCPAGVMHKVLR